MPNPSSQTKTALLDAQVDALIAGGLSPEAAAVQALEQWGEQSAGILHAAITKSVDPNYDATFVISAGDKDRVNDTIDPEVFRAIEAAGGRLIALWQHKNDQPVGYWEQFKAAGSRLIAKIKFASIPMARIAKQLIDDGVPLGASIGFRGKGEPNKYGGINYTAIELLECSIVSVPAHPRAVQIAKSFGMSLSDLGCTEQAPDAARLELIRNKSAAAVALANTHTSKVKS